ncbi:MAG: hypothetical protein DLM62_19515 [Pseudonocardiales bacterium]|nr:MAG: hypothetical protein DLM62_19515 [Pseudonocardiales bacterium]
MVASVSSSWQVHTVGAAHDAVRRARRIMGQDQLLTLGPTADAVIASFRAGSGPAAVLAVADPTRRIGLGRPAMQAGVSTGVIAGGAAARSYTQQGCGGSS